ncbi:protein NDNF-like [Asterias amurensis]|uniref:protein NDNF-like n=1 Tax=Asterias amurensis TaxID=7602 RepID=UPI003AB3DB03
MGANREPVNLNPAYREPANIKPANREPADIKPANLKPANREPSNLKPANREPSNIKPANREPANLKPANREPANIKPANREPANIKPANRKPANIKPANRGPANCEPTPRTSNREHLGRLIHQVGRRNYHTWCSVQSCLYGDAPPARPPNTGFGFENEKTKRDGYRRDRKRDKGGRDRDNGEEDDIIVECVGKKTLHTFTNLEPAQRYYFDLFAVDETNNRSIAYTGTSIITRPGPATRKHIALKDGNLRTSSVRRSSPVKTFNFSVGETVKDVLVTVQPCTESITAELWRDGTKIRSSNIRDLKDFRVREVTGDIQVKVKSLRRGSTHFRIFATTRPNKYPFPQLPVDKRIKVFENLRQCDSITLAWLSTKEVSQYCLYKREDRQKKRSKKSNREGNTQCHEPDMRKRTEKVICRPVSGPDTERDVLTETVTGLTPGTTYVFDVYVSSFGKQTLAYRSARVTTKKVC